MNKIVVMSLLLSCSLASANYEKLPQNPDYSWDSQSYRTTKPVEAKYHIYYLNHWKQDGYDDTNVPHKNKYGLYGNYSIELKNLPSDSFPLTRPTVDHDLPKIVKFDENEIYKRFKAIPKKTGYQCSVTGKMMAMFDVHYEGGDTIRFPDLVHGKVKSATPIGKPEIECRKFKI